jgi:DNA-binding MarR family transcriptional regulator
MPSPYLKFLATAHALDAESSTFQELDPLALRLLEIIAVKHDAGEPLTAMKATLLPATASQSTMHRKLTLLLNTGMVKMVHKDNNRRTKFIEPTEKAEDRFSKLGQAMGNLLTSSRDTPTPYLHTAHH